MLPDMTQVVILIVVVALILFGTLTFNTLVRLRNRTENAWSQVEVQLKRRHDLIPNLVETVKGYAAHEQTTFERVVAARNQALAARTIEEQSQAENVLTGALRQLFALAENYPELRASEQFSQLQSELSDTENKIAIARQIYNDTVLTYNNRVQTVPSNIVARLASFQPKPYFDFGPEVEEAPDVTF